MCVVADGYIFGALVSHQRKCERCGQTTRCIEIAKVEMPVGFGVEATILFDRKSEQQISFIGIGCGDYAKFHRQVAHITDSRMAAGHVV